MMVTRGPSRGQRGVAGGVGQMEELSSCTRAFFKANSVHAILPFIQNPFTHDIGPKFP